MTVTKDKKVISEAKSKIAQEKVRVNGRFVSTDGRTKSAKEKVQTEEAYKITDEDREAFGADSKAFFEWALTKAATRYEAAKYAKELMRFQYPSLSSQEVKTEVEITQAQVKWIWAEASEVVTKTIEAQTLDELPSTRDKDLLDLPTT